MSRVKCVSRHCPSSIYHICFSHIYIYIWFHMFLSIIFYNRLQSVSKMFPDNRCAPWWCFHLTRPLPWYRADKRIKLTRLQLACNQLIARTTAAARYRTILIGDDLNTHINKKETKREKKKGKFEVGTVRFENISSARLPADRTRQWISAAGWQGHDEGESIATTLGSSESRRASVATCKIVGHLYTWLARATSLRGPVGSALVVGYRDTFHTRGIFPRLCWTFQPVVRRHNRESFPFSTCTGLSIGCDELERKGGRGRNDALERKLRRLIGGSRVRSSNRRRSAAATTCSAYRRDDAEQRR